MHGRLFDRLIAEPAIKALAINNGLPTTDKTVLERSTLLCQATSAARVMASLQIPRTPWKTANAISGKPFATKV